jgi:hypothetical protein
LSSHEQSESKDLPLLRSTDAHRKRLRKIVSA